MPEVWGGLECTVNRVGSHFHDQVQRSGHAARLDDIDRLADLGIRRVRYPLLWERVLPHASEAPRWDVLDAHVQRLRERGVAPIAGLVHHGSGPADVSLLDPAFPSRLAAYARLVAERYPWIDMWTPVNEPLSTARFSGLYGHWYPHHRSDVSFVRILLHECRAAVEAMAAIRAVNPEAQYFHTDDVGVITASPDVAYQARFENERQMLAIDLIAGRVGPAHPLHLFLRRNGASHRELGWFQEHALLPDIIAGDYYITSDRHLDTQVAQHPQDPVGGNRRHRYVDIASSRLPGWQPGFEDALRRLWARYQRPVAIGEVHINAPREVQLRWARTGYDAAVRVERDGIPVRAVTFWALLGTFDWNDLCRSQSGHYEPGAFDIRGGAPRPTALAGAIRSLSAHGAFTHPVLGEDVPALLASSGAPSAPLLILGAGGTLGRTFVERCEQRGIAHVALRHHQLDVTQAGDVHACIAQHRPWAVINASGYVRVDDAELEAPQCRAVNVEGAVHVAQACERLGARLVSFSSDLVFDGAKASPYVESDGPAPLNVYGRSKRDAEAGVLAVMPGALVVRTSAFFGTGDDHNFVVRTLRQLRAHQRVAASAAVVSPTCVSSMADAVLDLLIDGAGGLWHLASPAGLSWSDWARDVARLARLDASLVYEAGSRDLAWRGERPRYSVLGTERGQRLPDFHESLERCVATLQGQVAPADR